MPAPRTAERADLAALASLERAVFPDAPYPGFFFTQALDLWPEHLWVVGDPLQGYALGAPGAGGTWLLSMAVHPDARGTGRGDALLTAFLAGTPGDAWLTVHPDNPARRLYLRHGFAEVSLDPEAFGPGEPRLRMRRPRIRRARRSG